MLVEWISRAEVLVRLALCMAAATVLMIMLHGWTGPQPFREGSVAPHGLVARVPFEKPDPERTRAAQERAAAQVRVVYAQDKAPAVRLRDGLKNRIAEIAAADSLATVSRKAWLEFTPDAADALELIPVEKPGERKPSLEPPVAPEPPEASGAKDDKTADKKEDAQQKKAGGKAEDKPEDTADAAKQEPTAAEEPPANPVVIAAEQVFQKFRARLDTQEKQLEFDKAIDRAFADIENKGVLEKIQHGIDEGSQTEIDVHPVGNAAELTRVQVADVLLGEAKVRLKARIEEELGEGPFADRVFGWIEPKLSGSLEIDRDSTAKAKREAVEKTPQQFVRYAEGDLLAERPREVVEQFPEGRLVHRQRLDRRQGLGDARGRHDRMPVDDPAHHAQPVGHDQQRGGCELVGRDVLGRADEVGERPTRAGFEDPGGERLWRMAGERDRHAALAGEEGFGGADPGRETGRPAPDVVPLLEERARLARDRLQEARQGEFRHRPVDEDGPRLCTGDPAEPAQRPLEGAQHERTGKLLARQQQGVAACVARLPPRGQEPVQERIAAAGLEQQDGVGMAGGEGSAGKLRIQHAIAAQSLPVGCACRLHARRACLVGADVDDESRHGARWRRGADRTVGP
jgi:hypothetical protein